MESIDSLIEAIEAFDGAVIIVTHSELILEAVATKLIVYDNDTVSVFEGTYLDFLERIGWSDEGGVKVKKGKKQETEKNVNRRDTKKQRTAIVSERSKTLSSLKKQIASLEEEITKLEFDVGQDTQRLTEVTVKGKALDIKRYSQTIRENKVKIDSLFAELETVTNEHDAKAKEFDQQLAEIS
jgi:ATP-binding cassette subfamily F protein 3